MNGNIFGERVVNLRLTPRTEAFVEHFATQLGLTNPMLNISSNRVSQEPIDRWVLSMCERSDAFGGS